MPGTPATSPRFGIARYADADVASFSAQVNAITDGFDAGAAKLAPAVSALPSSPVDGDEFFFVADVANGVVWRFRYRAASTSAHKWEFVGGADLLSGPVSGHFGAHNTGNTGSAGPAAITVPLAGDYDAMVTGGVTLLAGAELENTWTPGVTPPLSGMNYAAVGTETEIVMPICERHRFTNVAASGTIQVVYDNLNGTGTANIDAVQMYVRPIRVG